jgi:hypothetical protein
MDNLPVTQKRLSKVNNGARGGNYVTYPNENTPNDCDFGTRDTP